MKKSVIAFSMLMLLAASMVSATDTMIKIKTLPDHDVDVYALRVGETYNLIESFHKKSDSNGSVSVVLSTEEEKFNLKVGVRKDNTMIVSKKFNQTYTSGETAAVEIYPQWYLEQLAIEQSGNFADGDNSSAETLEVANESENETVDDASALNKTEEKSSDSNAITGFFTSIKEGVSGKAKYIIVFMIVVGVFYAGFSVWRKGSRARTSSSNAHILESAEQKIKELQEQLSKLKEK